MNNCIVQPASDSLKNFTFAFKCSEHQHLHRDVLSHFGWAERFPEQFK